jgi:4-hydroxy-tetrahydrodipicolinate reductase
MLRVLLAGHRGKVGTALVPALEAAADVEYVGGVGRGDDLRAALAGQRPDALVDFTHPAVGLEHALAAVEAGVAPVIGTSGIPAAGIDRLEAACAERGIGGIVAPNFAVGAVVMMWLAERAAPFFDAVEVLEMHAATKVDAPSGTAVATARRLAAARNRPFSYSKAEKVLLAGARGAESEGVAVHSVRLPGLVADQEVIFGLPGQTLTIGHRTTSREAYAPGVLLALRRVAADKRFYRGLDALLGLG